jgi:hypothetical protein
MERERPRNENAENASELPSEKKAEMKAASEGLEHLAQRLNELWSKEQLTPAEQKEVDLILNNAMVIEELMKGQTPEELA